MEVGLTQSVATTLGATQRIRDLLEKSQEKISTGQRANSFTDNPLAVSVAQSLSSRASNLLTIKDNISTGVSRANTAVTGLDFSGRILDQLKALAIEHEATSDTTRQAELSAQFDELARQLDGIQRDSSFGGTNLIGASPDTLNVTVNEDGSSSVTVTGQTTDSATLALDITDKATIDAAQRSVRSAARDIGTSASVLQIRDDFTQELVNNLREGEAKLLETDLNAEAANVLSLQTRNELSVAATGVAVNSQQSILQLF